MRVDVVGAGPAGLASALQLTSEKRRRRFDVHVWDRNPDVRTTPCGEGLHVDRLQELDGFDSKRYVGAWLDGVAVDAPDARRLLLDEPCATMRREDWLPALAAEAQDRGATLHMDTFLDEEDIRALPGDVVVGADGPSSRVARIVGNERRFMPATQIRLDATPRLDGRLIFLWNPEYSTDYAWVFPRGDHTSVGTLAPASSQTFAAMHRLAVAYGVEGAELRRESYPIPYGGKTMVGGRYVLVGDAAGVANPLTKGGMGPAFIQAKLLAGALDDGGVQAYADACASSPLLSDLPIRALAALHRFRTPDVARITGRRGPPISLGSGATLRMAWRTAWTLRPRLWRDSSLLVRALRHAVRWGW